MTTNSENKVENDGRIIFEKMDLLCINPLNHVQLIQLDPSGPFHSDEHLEFDYLIPLNDVCLVGEITNRSNPDDLKEKYNKFRKHFNLISSMDLSKSNFWELLGVPKNKLRYFRHIRSLKGIFIVTKLQRFDVSIRSVPNIINYFKAEWELLENYVLCIGVFAKKLFLSSIEINDQEIRRPIEISEKSNRLIRICDRKITSGEIGNADLFSFEASPYEMLPYACVYRYDILPSLDSSTNKSYQRTLIPEKLKKIRDNLLKSDRFMFPNSILVVLSRDCTYHEDICTLRIPDFYGAISVIDGQHRLFSYANSIIKERMGEDCRIMVTAIQFQSEKIEEIQQSSAKAFIEINNTQTPVKSAHIDAIAYPVLGEVYPRAIAAQVILKLNSRENKKLYGLFDTNQTSLGKIQTTTVLSSLQALTNLSKINNLQNAQRGNRLLIRRGYENLFSCNVKELNDPIILIDKSVIALERFYNLISYTFYHDWISRKKNNGSSLEFTKFFAAFIKLFEQFINEGLDWKQVEQELNSIKSNVLKLSNKTSYNAILFDTANSTIPDASPSLTNDFRFLNFNRKKPTSIQFVLSKK